MMDNASNEVRLFFLVTCILDTARGILTKGAATYEGAFARSTNLSPPSQGYLPPANFPSYSQDAVYAKRAFDLDDGVLSLPKSRKGDSSAEREALLTTSRFAAPWTAFDRPNAWRSTLSNQTSLTTQGRPRSSDAQPAESSSASSIKSTRVSSQRYNRYLPDREPYAVIEHEAVEELKPVKEGRQKGERVRIHQDDDSYELAGVTSDRDKSRQGGRYGESPDVTRAIKALDRFLSGVLNDREKGAGDGYNSELHRPPNPVLALVLSRYGHYVPSGPRSRGFYSYTATNNMHNNQPFGRYKLEYDD